MLEKYILEDDMKCCFNSIVSTTTFSYENKWGQIIIGSFFSK